MLLTSKITQLDRRGYTRGEIMRLTGATESQYDNWRRNKRFDEMAMLERIARRLLHKVPTWWCGTNAEWRRVVHGNFADVLG